MLWLGKKLQVDCAVNNIPVTNDSAEIAAKPYYVGPQ